MITNGHILNLNTISKKSVIWLLLWTLKIQDKHYQYTFRRPIGIKLKLSQVGVKIQLFFARNSKNNLMCLNIRSSKTTVLRVCVCVCVCVQNFTSNFYSPQPPLFLHLSYCLLWYTVNSFSYSKNGNYHTENFRNE